MKKVLENQFVFTLTLKLLSFISKWKLTKPLIQPITSFLARLNLYLNRPEKTKDLKKLAETWKALMPPDGQNNFKISTITTDTAYVEIHLNCPLRGTGEVHTCHSFMNYDRELMKSIGGNLVELESQSNSGNPFCKLAIRKLDDKVDDLTPAHLNANTTRYSSTQKSYR